jgi:hypothetical protein
LASGSRVEEAESPTADDRSRGGVGKVFVMAESRLFGFPNPVNETSARVVASGVVAMATTAALADQPWIMFPLAYGFAARVAAGPKLSPLGILATRVVTPRLHIEHRYSPGPPKRLAQALGLVTSVTALILHYGTHRPRAAKLALGCLATAAGLEAAFGLCLGCKLFQLGVRTGVVPESICEECNDIWGNRQQGAA